jgi:hypothetical protein
MDIEQIEIPVDQPKEIYDADNDKMIPNPLLEKKEPAKEESKKPAPKAKSEETEEEEEQEETDESENEEESEEEEEQESEEEESENEEEEEEEEESDDKKKTDKDEKVLDSVDAVIEDQFSEKFGVKTAKEIENLITNALDVQDELESLKKTNEELKAAKPKFLSAAHEAAYNLVSQFDPKLQGEALQTFAKLVGMDLESASPEMALEEEFIHKNPHWSRSEAQRMFKKQFAKTYTLDRTKFEGTDEEFEEEKKDLELLLKGDAAKAKAFLKETREKHKPATEAEKPKVSEVVTKAVEQTTKQYSDFVEKTGEITFGDGEDKFVFKLDADRKKQASQMLKNWVSNPTSYDEKGALIGAEGPENALKNVIGALFINEIVKDASASASSKASTKRLEDLAKKKPKKRTAPASGEGQGSVGDDLDEQARRIIKLKGRKAA